MKTIACLSTSLFSALLFFSSCQKDPSELDSDLLLNKTYTYQYVEAGKIRAFTQQGEVTKEANLNRVKQRFEVLNYDSFQFLSDHASSDLQDQETIRFDGEYAINAQGKKRRYSQQDGLLTVVAADTSYFLTLDPSSQPPVYAFNVMDLGKHQPYRRLFSVPTTVGFRTMAAVVPEEYWKIADGKLKYPILCYFVYKNYGSYFSIRWWRSNNELNESIYTEMVYGDTVLVQESWAIFE
jgi:hypothetical protein